MSPTFKKFAFGVPWEEAAGYSQAVRAGDLLFISGQLSHDAAGTFLGADDFDVQLQATFDNLDRVLEQFGAGRADIAEVNIFLVELRTNFDATAASSKRYFGEHRPASNLIGVEALAFPDQLVEIAATAVLEDS